ncbi:hypothetical protein CCM_07532 [Cordyceps militaris CM01]|uniref:Uncharacterized protein n=1 Tax=Cordyceps militaris (strain CM01) TaxID=983644 RepID=G3JQ29_CORMM|nr:uncharacterized protein CCM_07532 [Cordyceps militaris CM01]EGX89280.1 hypothetical protein CCM_07532 [Cordyceps militaris CM01]
MPSFKPRHLQLHHIVSDVIQAAAFPHTGSHPGSRGRIRRYPQRCIVALLDPIKMSLIIRLVACPSRRNPSDTTGIAG